MSQVRALPGEPTFSCGYNPNLSAAVARGRIRLPVRPAGSISGQCLSLTGRISGACDVGLARVGEQENAEAEWNRMRAADQDHLRAGGRRMNGGPRNAG